MKLSIQKCAHTLNAFELSNFTRLCRRIRGTTAVFRSLIEGVRRGSKTLWFLTAACGHGRSQMLATDFGENQRLYPAELPPLIPDSGVLLRASMRVGGYNCTLAGVPFRE